MLFTKRIETFWFRDFSTTRELEHIFLSIFRYIFWYKYTKIRKQKNLNFSQAFFNYIKCHKEFNTLRLYRLKAFFSKNPFYFFFLIL